MIDRSGPLWKGSDFEDLTEFLVAFTAASKPASRISQIQCGCGSQRFHLALDDDEGCAARTCAACGESRFIADSEEFWEDASPGTAQCPCGGEEFELGVAFSLREDGDVCWITVGGRCGDCGGLGAYVDWKIDYSPTDHLFELT